MKRFGRWMFNGLTTASLVLFLATAVLWVRSYKHVDFALRLGADHSWWVGTYAGGLQFIHEVPYVADGRPLELFFIDESPEPVGETTPIGIKWFGWSHVEIPHRDDGPFSVFDLTGLVIPMYFLLIALLLLPGMAAYRIWRGQPKPGICPACGCDLRATPDRCPECGTIPPKDGKA